MTSLYIWCWLVASFTCSLVSFTCGHDVSQLTRPGANSSDPTRVSISFGLLELREFDIVNQEVVMVGWTALKWEDPRPWESAEGSQGADEISISPNEIWVPDVILTNSISKAEPIHTTRVHVTRSGQVTWVNTFRYHFYCKISTDSMDAETFDCFLNFASWSMGNKVLDLYNKGDRLDANYYVNNREWELFKNKASKDIVEMPWAEGVKTSQVKYAFTLKRRQQPKNDDDNESAASKVKVMAVLPALLMLITKLLS